MSKGVVCTKCGEFVDRLYTHDGKSMCYDCVTDDDVLDSMCSDSDQSNECDSEE